MINPTVADAMLTIARVRATTTTAGEIRTLFDEDHIQPALIVAEGNLLTRHRQSQPGLTPRRDPLPAPHLGRLNGLVTSPLERTRQRKQPTGGHR